MRLSLLTVVAAAAIAAPVAAPVAEAAPLVPLVADGAEPAPTLVAQGCGLGYSRGAYGRCRPNSFGFGVPGARRYGYGGYYGYGRPYGYYGYGYRPYRYGY